MPNSPAHRLWSDASELLLGKWKYVAGVVGFIIMAAGFDFKTPHQQFQTLNARIDSVHAASVTAETEQLRQQDLLESLVRLSCYKEPAHVTQLAGLPCDRLTAKP